MKYLAILFSLFLLSNNVDAQRIGATINVQTFEINKTDDNGFNKLNDYDGNISFSGNVRFYTPRKWAYRVGAAWQNIEYTIDGGLETDYKAKRSNYTAILGLEKHFNVALFDIYPGVYFPITYKGQDKLLDAPASYVLDGVSNGDFHIGTTVMTGVRMNLLGFLHVGAEFNLGYEQFKQEVIDQIGEGIKVKNIGFSTDFVIGISF